jgi:hypothetical protein
VKQWRGVYAGEASRVRWGWVASRRHWVPGEQRGDWARCRSASCAEHGAAAACGASERGWQGTHKSNGHGRDNGGERKSVRDNRHGRETTEEKERKKRTSGEDDMWVSHVSYLIPHSIVLKPNKELGRTYSYQPNTGWLQPNPKN